MKAYQVHGSFEPRQMGFRNGSLAFKHYGENFYVRGRSPRVKYDSPVKRTATKLTLDAAPAMVYNVDISVRIKAILAKQREMFGGV